MTDEKEVAKWLQRKFLDWQIAQGELKKIKEFAKYLGIPQSTLNNYMKGNRTPQGENVNRIGRVLGFEIYSLLGMVPSSLNTLLDHLSKLNDQQLDDVLHYIEGVLTEKTEM